MSRSDGICVSCPTSSQIRVQTIERLRPQRWTGKQIAAEAGVSPAIVSRVLHRLGLKELSALEPEPVRRYEREHRANSFIPTSRNLAASASLGGASHHWTADRHGQPASRHWLGVRPRLH